VPQRALRVCRCGQVDCAVHSRQQARAALDLRRLNDPLRKLYKTVRWKNTRIQVIARDPVCVLCNSAASIVADHRTNARRYIQLNKGNVEAFFDQSNLQGVCKRCHDKKTAGEVGFYGNH